MVGPSAASARARVVFAVDGLEVKIWGGRDSTTTSHPENEADSEGTEEESEVGSSSSEASSESGDVESESGSDLGLDSDSILQSDEESDSESSSADSIIDDTPPSPPASRSPSPDCPPECSPECSPGLSPPSSPKSTPQPPADLTAVDTPRPSQLDSSHADSQAAIRAAERLLSRTLACSCAEEGGGMAAELAPTQTHILLRAPRRFSHPAWTPKMSAARAMDRLVDEFLEESGPVRKGAVVGKAKKRKGLVEGVWIRCRSKSVAGHLPPVDGDEEAEDGDEVESEDEEDELIWWTWDGKLVGFADW